MNTVVKNYNGTNHPTVMPRKKTNSDKFRAMSDEELAKTISGDAIYPWCTEEPCKYESCTDCVLAWLKQEVSDG